MTQIITLPSNVVVSDPCYEMGTWCMDVLDNVLPGKYHSFVDRIDMGDWGHRNSMLLVVHEDYVNSKLKWVEHSRNIGVDSGQAGIFSLESYRNDSLSETIGSGDGDISFFEKEPWASMGPDKETGDVWYRLMCSRTLSEKGSGAYDSGIVCSSGIGDGMYPLYIAIKKRKIVALCVDFLVSDDEYINFDFYKTQLV